MAELFDYLYDESAIFEGEQAEEYKARKQAAKDASKKDDENYMKNRWGKKNHSSEIDALSYAGKGRNRTVHVDKTDGEVWTTEKQPGNKMTKNNPNYGIKHPIKTSKGKKEDKSRSSMADKSARKSGAGGTVTDIYRAKDAVNRHARRHPTKESVELYGGIIELD